MRAYEGAGANWQSRLLLNETSAAGLLDLDVGTPILHEFERAPIAFADSDGPLDVLLCIHVLTHFAEQAHEPGVFIFG
jgi:hypothetical protein